MAKHKGKKGAHHHTGHIRHADMTSLPVGMGSKDPHADPMHHKANAAHDMPLGMSPGGMVPEPGGPEGEGGEGMTGNAECCE